MRMIRQVGESFVFPAQPFIDAAAVPGHQFDNADHITQGIEHLVSDAEATAAQLRLDSKTIGQDEILGQIGQVIGDFLPWLCGAAYIGIGFIFPLGQDQLIERFPGYGRARVTVLRIKLAKFL